MAIDDRTHMALETHVPTPVGENTRKSYSVRNNAVLIENVIQGFEGVVMLSNLKNQIERPIFDPFEEALEPMVIKKKKRQYPVIARCCNLWSILLF